MHTTNEHLTTITMKSIQANKTKRATKNGWITTNPGKSSVTTIYGETHKQSEENQGRQSLTSSLLWASKRRSIHSTR